MSEITTIQVRIKTKNLLEELKEHPRETYDDVLTRLAEAALKLKEA